MQKKRRRGGDDGIILDCFLKTELRLITVIVKEISRRGSYKHCISRKLTRRIDIFAGFAQLRETAYSYKRHLRDTTFLTPVPI